MISSSKSENHYLYHAQNIARGWFKHILFLHTLKMDWTRQNATTLSPTYNTYARTFTQSTTIEEMKIDITHTHTFTPPLPQHTHPPTHTLMDNHLHNPPPELHKTLYKDHTSLFVSKIQFDSPRGWRHTGRLSFYVITCLPWLVLLSFYVITCLPRLVLLSSYVITCLLRLVLLSFYVNSCLPRLVLSGREGGIQNTVSTSKASKNVGMRIIFT